MSRFLVTWRDRSRRRAYAVGVLTVGEVDFHFSYLPAAATTPDFRPFVNFPELGSDYQSATLFPFFSQRVMDRRRPDHAPYLHALGLAHDATDTDVLGRSNGQRKGDTVHVIAEPQVDSDGGVDHTFLVSGVRYAPGNEGKLEDLHAGDSLTLRAEPENPVNGDAVLVCSAHGDPLGWVPDALLHMAHEVMKGAHELTALRINDADWPSHLRFIVRLTGSVPPGFDPFPAMGARASA